MIFRKSAEDGRRYVNQNGSIAIELRPDGTAELFNLCLTPSCIKERVHDALRRNRSMKQTEVLGWFHRSVAAPVITAALEELEREGIIYRTIKHDGKQGRPPVVWSMTW